MSERHIPAVGDMVRLSHWADAYESLEVIAVGRTTFLTLAIDHSDTERQWSLDDDWVQVVQLEPLTETWTAVRANGEGYRIHEATSFATTLAGYKAAWSAYTPVAIIHAWTDSDGDHVEIERVTT
jgi:hypothetical protein